MSTIRLLVRWDEGLRTWVAKALGIGVHGRGLNVGAACLDWSAVLVKVINEHGRVAVDEVPFVEAASWEAARPHPGQDMGYADIETRVDVGILRAEQRMKEAEVRNLLSLLPTDKAQTFTVDDARKAVETLRKESACEHCMGEGCSACQGTGKNWSPQHVDASLAIFLSPDGHVLAMRRIEDGRIGLPGGKREPPDPTDKATLVREVAEELGIKLSESMLRLVHRGPGVVPGIVSVFHVESVSFEYGLRIGRLAQEAGFETVLLNYRRLCESEPYGRWHRSVFPDGFGHLRPTEMR